MTREFLNYSELQPWEREIVDKYPSIYRTPNPRIRDFYGDKYEELIANPEFTNLRYGFEFEKGWAKLVDEFSETAFMLVSHLRAFGIQSDAYIHSCIFKEKMGTLCWQGDINLIEPFRKLFWAYIGKIKNASTTICELSGKPGVACHRGAWRKTLCQEEAQKRGYTPEARFYKEMWEKSQ